MDDLLQAEAAHRERLLSLLGRIPQGVPRGWTRERYVVGGLPYIGFSNLRTEKLLCVSPQGLRLIDCKTAGKIPL